jgi:DNA-binding NtrC family response regulator
MSSQQQLNVLVVDSDGSSRSEIEGMLASEGYKSVSLENASLAREEVRNKRFQIVILDVSPENPEGVAALQQIRKADSDLCVIATSSNPSVGMAVKIMKHQAFHYLKKPIASNELCDVVKDAIREKGLLVDLETRLNTAIGTRIRERRHSRPLTLKQLANRTGLSVSLISQIELGKSAASMSTLHKLATALHTDMTYFFETV